MSQLDAIAIIPVRMSSERLPGKPLAEIAGQTLVERVWRATSNCQELSARYVATDSEEIAACAKKFGAEVVMTESDITTGSQRVAAAAKSLGVTKSLVVNVQGDMPFINPLLVDETINMARSRSDFAMITAATPITDKATFDSNSVVKVVVSQDSQALYFSRAPIPHSRDGQLLEWLDDSGSLNQVYGYKHFGLYVFQADALKKYEVGEFSSLEKIEKLEQLRLLESGLKVGVYVASPTMTHGSIEVDTAKDLEAANKQAKSD